MTLSAAFEPRQPGGDLRRGCSPPLHAQGRDRRLKERGGGAARPGRQLLELRLRARRIAPRSQHRGISSAPSKA